MSRIKSFMMNSIFWTGLFAASLIISCFIYSPVNSKPSVTPVITLDYPYIEQGKKGIVNLLVEFDVEQFIPDSTAQRPPLNVSLVIDRSGSMKGAGKMQYAIEAAKMLIDRLNNQDLLSIVAYDDKINLLQRSAPLTDKSNLKNLVSELIPRGSTNLTGGMQRGADEVKSAKSANSTNRVILLSDGQANEGITNPRRIGEIVRDYRNDGIQITSMGLGLDYNEDLMASIAENSGGNYYFIENPTQLEDIYEQEMSIMFAIVAKEVTFIYHPSENITKSTVHGYPFITYNNQNEVKMEPFYSEEKRSFLIEFHHGPAAGDSLHLGNIQFSYYDVTDSKTKEFNLPVSVKIAEKPDVVDQQKNSRVIVESLLRSADRAQKKATTLVEKEEFSKVKVQYDSTISQLKKENKKLKDVALEKRIESLELEQQQVELYQNNSQAMSQHLKSTKQRQYQQARGKTAYTFLQKGDKGKRVELLQKALTREGFYNGPVDGLFSENLVNALKDYQKASGIKVDGVAGPKTLNMLGIF